MQDGPTEPATHPIRYDRSRSGEVHIEQNRVGIDVLTEVFGAWGAVMS